jgi:putative acetyltransferase
MRIRPELPSDDHAVGDVNRAAFPSDLESRLVDALRAAGKAVISLVADYEGAIGGHILFSAVSVERGSGRGLGLAPLAVVPALQRKGVGTALTQAGIAAAKAGGYDFVVVLGEPEYYGRFGFTKASSFGLKNEYGVDEPFMAMELSSGALSHVSGLVKYAAEFSIVDSP